MTFSATPPLGSILHGCIVPDGGRGDTEFASMSAAFDALDETMRKHLVTVGSATASLTFICVLFRAAFG
jgi:alpha-ketoglutarate-dependent taurine dioxygenase